MARSYGTNNLPDCSNMCHESSGTALPATIGIGKGSVSLADIHHADLILVVGQNPGTNHPRMLSALTEAKEHGAHIVAVNPLPEAGPVQVPRSADRHRADPAVAPNSPTISCRSSWAATWPCSRRSATC